MWYAKYTRIGLTAIVFGIAVWQFVEGEIGNGIFLTLLAALVLVTVWVNEAMLFAFLALRKQNMAKTSRWLDRITKPDLLAKDQQAYYYYLRAIVMSQSGEMGKSESLFKKALGIGLRLNQDKAMAKINLAGIAASRRRKREAQNWLAQAKKDDDKKMLSDQIKMMQNQLKRI